MRALPVSSIGAICTAVLALPLAIPTGATASNFSGSPGQSGWPGVTGPSGDAAAPAGHRPTATRLPGLAGRTQSLALSPLPGHSPSTRAGTATGRETPRSSDSGDTVLSEDESGGTYGLAPRKVEPFSLLGVVWDHRESWDEQESELPLRVRVRTRAAGTGEWSGWQDLHAHSGHGGHAPDRDSAEHTDATARRGGTAPLWVGESDGVQVRVEPGTGGPPESGRRAGSGASGTGGGLPSGMRLELIDPGEGPPRSADAGDGSTASAAGSLTLEAAASGAANAPLAPVGAAEIPSLSKKETEAEALTLGSHAGPGAGKAAKTVAGTGTATGAAPLTTTSAGTTPVTALGTAPKAGTGTPWTAAGTPWTAAGASPGTGTPAGSAAAPKDTAGVTAGVGTPVRTAASRPFIGPRPRIVTRAGWQADESLREKQFLYTDPLQAAFVHHTAGSNTYTCSQAPSIIRSIYRYHVRSMGWRDIGYNFLVDKCGTLYEGRAGGVAKPVMGAHTYGFNRRSLGIAVLGSYGLQQPSAPAVQSIAGLTAWKLGLFGADPRAITTMVSGGGKYPAGKKVQLYVISGHRDGNATECPGTQLYGKLGTARSTSARLQGRL